MSKKLLRWVTQCNQHNPQHFIPFYIQSQAVGAIHHSRIELFQEHPDIFTVTSEAIVLQDHLHTPVQRTHALAEILSHWQQKNYFRGRNEYYRVCTDFTLPALMEMDRGATSLFGVRKYGIHLNGLTWRDGQLHMWIARRSAACPIFPLRLDQMVAGGLTAGYTAQEVLLKESAEEANIPEKLVKQAKAVGLLTYTMDQEQTCLSNTLFLYDIFLPEDFKPQNTDGEVEDFYCLPIDEVIAKVKETDEFKTNSNLVIIDFMVRYGYLTPDETHYSEIVQGLVS
ncbi:DUF4743 domain-containing protein [Candidatus Venteria ishoeyi]|uniref:DUF4743 domain-containing protein n=1 Tax=Candidatus Venteria ishoeyi TaxID=1899563 RepID=UPI0025A5ADF1|nr:DUF4743 domain-containing protein [Candidatus Venteria ishoeyi]MDM8546282.1 DUF4743 domain-containing protein [Candidatus Venteria ishoeyi]